jgi:hypothetical protein
MCGVSVKTMGSSLSTKSESVPAEGVTTKSNNVRASIRTKQPMPDANELERRFTKVLVSVNKNYVNSIASRTGEREEYPHVAHGCSQMR